MNLKEEPVAYRRQPRDRTWKRDVFPKRMIVDVQDRRFGTKAQGIKRFTDPCAQLLDARDAIVVIQFGQGPLLEPDRRPRSERRVRLAPAG